MKAIIHSSVECSGKKISIEASGYKHASSMVILSALAGELQCNLENVPNITDTHCLCEILKDLGCCVSYRKNSFSISQFLLKKSSINPQLAKQIHNTIYLLPALGYKFAHFHLPITGGCAIGNDKDGARPTSHIVDIMRRSGAICKQTHEGIFVRSPSKIKPLEIDIMEYSIFSDRLAGPLVSGATKTAILIAIQCNERSVIRNPYLKGDVLSMVEFLSMSGFEIHLGTNAIYISKCRKHNTIPRYTIISDPTEIVTLMCLSVYCDIHIEIKNVTPVTIQRELKADQEFLKKLGIYMLLDEKNTLTFRKEANANNQSVHLEILSGDNQILSDHQPFYALLIAQNSCGGMVIDYVWKKRFSYAEELNKMLNAFTVEDNMLNITQCNDHGADTVVFGKDLRSVAVLLIAAIKRNATTTVYGLEHLDRGYSNFINILWSIGVDLTL